MDLKDLQAIFPNRTSLRVAEFCTAGGFGTTFFYWLLKEKKIRVQRIGRVTLIPMTEVAIFFESPATSTTVHDAKKAR